MTTATARRLVLPHFLSSQECKELEFIHKSCGVVGYRPYVLSTTMHHLVATNCANLIIPILPIRERVKEVVEQRFGREYELFVEFTGLISWTKGAHIGWHSDNNKPYLRQRHYSAVCYLNNYEQDFKGGLFHFQEGEPLTIIPSLGTVIIYTADERNMHRVDEVTGGERCTLALWFTSDQVHDEDQKIIRQISTAVPDLQACLSDVDPEGVLCKLPPKGNASGPTAASSVMYNIHTFKYEHDQLMKESTFAQPANPDLEATRNDLRVLRMASVGVNCRFTSTVVEDQHNSPVVLVYNQKEVPCFFSSSLEALQVVQFHEYKRAMIKSQPSRFWGKSLENPFLKTMTGSIRLQSAAEAGVGDGYGYTAQKRTATSCHGPHWDTLEETSTTEHTGEEKNVLVSLNKTTCEDLNDLRHSIQLHDFYSSNLWEKLFECFPSWTTGGTLSIHH